MIYKARISPDLEMHCRIDDFTDPWQAADSILMLHGNAESGAVWFGWVPHLARHFRVVRPDMRGFGDSTPMPLDFQWSLDRIVDDYVELMRSLNIRRFHLVGAKLGGTVARRFAARYPELVRTLTVVGTPPRNAIRSQKRFRHGRKSSPVPEALSRGRGARCPVVWVAGSPGKAWSGGQS